MTEIYNSYQKFVIEMYWNTEKLLKYFQTLLLGPISITTQVEKKIFGFVISNSFKKGDAFIYWQCCPKVFLTAISNCKVKVVPSVLLTKSNVEKNHCHSKRNISNQSDVFKIAFQSDLQFIKLCLILRIF